jgi:beta-hydroxylase
MRVFEKVLMLTKGGRTAFFAPEDFPWTADLRKRWPAIRSELDRLLENLDDVPNFQDIQIEQRELTTDDKWKTYAFYGYGVSVDRNQRECPATADAIFAIPGMTSAMFSILAGNKRLPPHRGPYKGVLRYHLGLKVPQPDRCGIRVREQVARWEEGKELIFDDTYEHEAWNDGAEPRVVLFVDFLRPLPFPLSSVNRAVIRVISKSPFIQDAKGRLEDWFELIDRRRGAEPGYTAKAKEG